MPRPQIQLQTPPADRKLEWGGITLLASMWAIAGYAYYTLPAVIATHFNAAGKVDAHGGNVTLGLLPSIATIIYAGLTLLSSHPHIFNYPVAITEHNAQRQYSIAVRILRWLKLATVLVFTLALIMIWHVSEAKSARPQVWVLPLILVLVLAPVLLAVLQMFKARDNDGI